MLVPIITGGVTAGILWSQPQEFAAKATVVLPLPADSGSPIGAVDQLVSNFEGAIQSESVVREVADELGLEASDIRSNLSTRQVAASNLVEVIFVGEDADQAIEIVESGIDKALEFREDLGSPEARALPLTTQATEVSRVESVGRGALTAAVVAFVLTLGLVLLIRALRS